MSVFFGSWIVVETYRKGFRVGQFCFVMNTVMAGVTALSRTFFVVWGSQKVHEQIVNCR